MVLSRREWLRIGGFGAAGLTLHGPSRGSPATDIARDRSFGQAKNLLFLFLSGGPSQYETFDPKPDAPTEIRGIFKPIATKVPGVRICELLPRTARIADKLCIVRSMSTGDPNHESSGYWVNTGHRYTGSNMRATHPTDWPTFGSIVKMLKPSSQVPFSAVVLPEPIIANPGIFLPGQNGGFLGTRWDPEYFRCDPAAPDFKIEGFDLPTDLLPARLDSSGHGGVGFGIVRLHRLSPRSTVRAAKAADRKSTTNRMPRESKSKVGRSSVRSSNPFRIAELLDLSCYACVRYGDRSSSAPDP